MDIRGSASEFGFKTISLVPSKGLNRWTEGSKTIKIDEIDSTRVLEALCADLLRVLIE